MGESLGAKGLCFMGSLSGISSTAQAEVRAKRTCNGFDAEPCGLEDARSAVVVGGVGRVRWQAVALGGVEDGRAIAVHQATLAAHLHGSIMVLLFKVPMQ